MSSMESRMSKIEMMLERLASNIGFDEDTPKTTARMSERTSGPAMAVKRKSGSKLMDDVVLENVGGNRADGRMRIPARMFGTRDTITVNGVKFTKLESDQNRSANFNPAILDANVGDTLTFSHQGGSKWTVEVESGSRKRKAPAKKVTRKTETVPASTKMSLKDAAKKFGKLALKNAADDFENENIPNEEDPRHYLTSRENAQAKRVWKRQHGITLKEWVTLLSKEVFD